MALYTVPKLPVPSFSSNVYWLAGLLLGMGYGSLGRGVWSTFGEGGGERALDFDCLKMSLEPLKRNPGAMMAEEESSIEWAASTGSQPCTTSCPGSNIRHTCNQPEQHGDWTRGNEKQRYSKDMTYHGNSHSGSFSSVIYIVSDVIVRPALADWMKVPSAGIGPCWEAMTTVVAVDPQAVASFVSTKKAKQRKIAPIAPVTGPL